MVATWQDQLMDSKESLRCGTLTAEEVLGEEAEINDNCSFCLLLWTRTSLKQPQSSSWWEAQWTKCFRNMHEGYTPDPQHPYKRWVVLGTWNPSAGRWTQGKLQSQLAAILAEMAISHLVRDQVSKSKVTEENVQPWNFASTWASAPRND